MDFNKLLNNRLVNFFLGVLLIITLTECLLVYDRLYEVYFFSQNWILFVFKQNLWALYSILFLANFAAGSIVKGKSYATGSVREFYNEHGRLVRTQDLMKSEPLTEDQKLTVLFFERILNFLFIGIWLYYLVDPFKHLTENSGFLSFQNVFFYFLFPFIGAFFSPYFIAPFFRVKFMVRFFKWCCSMGMIVRKIIIGLSVTIILYFVLISLFYFIKNKDYNIYIDFIKGAYALFKGK